MARDRFGVASVAERLDHNDFYVFAFHGGNNCSEVRSRWRNAGLKLQEQVDAQVEAAGKIGPRIVIRYHALSLERGKRGLPLLHPGIERRVEFFSVGLV